MAAVPNSVRRQLERLPERTRQELALGEISHDCYVVNSVCRVCAVLLPVIEREDERWRCAATVFDWHQLIGEGGPLYEGEAVYERCLAIYEAAKESTCRTTRDPASTGTTRVASTR